MPNEVVLSGAIDSCGQGALLWTASYSLQYTSSFGKFAERAYACAVEATCGTDIIPLCVLLFLGVERQHLHLVVAVCQLLLAAGKLAALS